MKKSKKDKEMKKIRFDGKAKIIKKDNTPRNKRFENLCLKSQEDLKEWLTEYFKNLGKGIVNADGFLYVEGSLPVLLVAHMDTVHKELPREIVYENGTISSPQGIGGDDRCGVYAILEILKELDCPVCFFEDEEIGGVGSEKFAETRMANNIGKSINYVIQIDRKGDKDAVYYDQDNRKFELFVSKTNYWKKDWGSFTDICHICPAMDVSGVNLSSGYYKQHTTDEYVVLDELYKIIEETKKLIKTESDRFEYIETKYNSLFGRGYGYYDYWDYCDKENNPPAEDYFYITYYGDKGEETEFLEAVSDLEAIGKFLFNHPSMSYSDIVDVGFEDDFEWPTGDDGTEIASLITG